ncbi:hypothetical protein CMUS01_16672 [Colletotrichum musicola]|uniref:Uncharacterized protein n=1 Tax=Colletotrichum musicola TaxID=2175873 RepID=A0A8H6ILQ6_9PEZI|nr:hypothetical protein CMUS01_16672 [Colletotrichum musicola]
MFKGRRFLRLARARS